VVPEGQAAITGKIVKGTQITTINGSSVLGFDQKQAAVRCSFLNGILHPRMLFDLNPVGLKPTYV
jgi:hypothetical protein